MTNIDGKELNSATIVKMYEVRSKIKCSKKNFIMKMKNF